MINRDVTAVLLVGAQSVPADLSRTLSAIEEQDRPPDRVIAVAPRSENAEIDSLLRAAERAGTIYSIARVSTGTTLAGAVRQAVIASGAAADEEDELLEEHADSAHEPSARGRRARNLDVQAIERRKIRDAQQRAKVPTRLRPAETGAAGRRRRAIAADERWLWFLTPVSAPEPGALAALISTVDATASTAIAGAKHRAVMPDGQAPKLVDLGVTLTHSNRIETGVDGGEIDQGQADWRTDVLGTTLPGMLVRTATLTRLGGFDPALTSPWAELELSQRVWRSGERVATSADSHVSVPRSYLTGAADPVRFRASQVLALVRYRPTAAALLTLLILPFITLLRVLGAIIAHRPRAVWTETLAMLRIYRYAPGVFARGRASRSLLRVPRRRLAPLFVPRGAALRSSLERAWTSVFADDEQTRRIKRTTWGIAGTTHGADDADFGRHTVWSLILAVASVVLALTALRPLLTGGRLTGDALLPPTDAISDRMDTVFSSWIPGELGAAGPSDALTRLIGIIPLTGSALVLLITMLAIPAAAFGAWLASGTLTRSVLVRLLAAAAWACAPPFLSVLLSGRWPLVLVHVLIPVAAHAFAHAVGLPNKTRYASPAAAAGAGLVLAVIGAVQPVLALALLLGVLAALPFLPGRRLRMLWLLIPPLAVQLPNLGAMAANPKALIAVSGVEGSFEQPDLLHLALLSPEQESPLAGALGMEQSPARLAAPAALLILMAIAALIAPFLAGAAGRVGRYAVAGAAGAFVLAVLLGRFVVGFDLGTPFSTYPAGALSLLCAAIITGFLCTGDAIAHRTEQNAPARIWARRTLGAVGALTAAAVVITWTVIAPSALSISRDGGADIPAVAADQGVSANRTRTLVLTQQRDGSVSAEVVTHAGRSIDLTSSVENARVAERGETSTPFDTASLRLTDAIAQNLADDGSAAVIPLSEFAFQYVVVPAGTGSDAIAQTLSTSPRFERVTESDAGGLWRVVEPSARVMIRDAAPGEALATAPGEPVPSERTDVSAPVSSADHERTVVLSERASSGWRASLNGQALRPVTVDGWAQGFVLPAGASGKLQITHELPLHRTFVWIGFGVLAVTVLVALPWRPRTREEAL